jgi:hypothetical protein
MSTILSWIPDDIMVLLTNSISAVNPFEVLKLRLLEAHVLSEQQKMDALFQLDMNYISDYY